MQTERSFHTQNIGWQARLQGVPLASFRARAAAFLIDTVIIAVPLAIPAVWNHMHALDGQSQPLVFEFGGVWSVAFAIVYFGVCNYLGNGRTPGKRLLGIRVVSLVHGRLSLWHSFERALGYAASFLEAGFGFLQYFLHPNHQTVHDRIAETIVVDISRRDGKAH